MKKTLTFRVLATLYLLSGALGLVYEVAFNKYLAYAFGATAYASSAVLVAFMGGIAAGAYLAGRAEPVVERPLLVYGAIEVALGGFCLSTPWLFEIVQRAYIDFARQQHSLVTLTVGRALIATTIVLMPALGMGATLPLLARFVHGMRHSWAQADGAPPEAKVAALYGINTLGGALGSLVSAYLILPTLGLSTTLRASALVSVSIGLFSIISGWSLVIPAPRPAGPVEGVIEGRPEGELGSRELALLGALSGFLVFSCEVVFVHLLAVVIGTSVYAFGLMLFIFLVCLSVGTPLAHRLHRRLGAHLLPSSLVATGLALVLSLLVWDHLPTLFIALGPRVRSWPGRELTRGLAAFVSLAVPVTLMGMTFPLLLRGVRREHATREVGRITTYNTVGSIVGSILAGFVMLARLGSYRSLVVIGLLYVAAGALVAWRLALRERRTHLAFGGACLVVIALLPRWDLARLTSGANVYFDKGVVDKGQVESIREDVHGGVTTIVRDPASGERTLMTNGKFEGNDNREIHPNRGFAHLPSALAEKRKRALVVGLGTGTTLGTMTAYPYERIDVAELAPAIVDAARTIFAGVNRRALEDPRVRVLHEDGRNVLLTATEPYDVVTIEVTSIWFAGAANLYNRDFYEMVADRLAYGGVLQQWLQFHHTDRRTVATVLATIREVFPHVILVVNGHQGHMLASNQPLTVSRDGLFALEKEGQVAQTLDGHPLVHYVKGVVLDEPSVERFIAETAKELQISPSELISTDDNLRLEYRTPKGNVPTADDIETTLRYLYSYRQPKAVLSVLQP